MDQLSAWESEGGDGFIDERDLTVAPRGGAVRAALRPAPRVRFRRGRSDRSGRGSDGGGASWARRPVTFAALRAASFGALMVSVATQGASGSNFGVWG